MSYGHAFPTCARGMCFDNATTISDDDGAGICARHAIAEVTQPLAVAS